MYLYTVSCKTFTLQIKGMQWDTFVAKPCMYIAIPFLHPASYVYSYICTSSELIFLWSKICESCMILVYLSKLQGKISVEKFIHTHVAKINLSNPCTRVYKPTKSICISIVIQVSVTSGMHRAALN